MSLSAPDKKVKAPLRDRIIPWYFVMAFAVVFIVNGIFILFATGTHTGLVTENPYEKGLDFDHIVKETQKRRGMQ